METGYTDRHSHDGQTYCTNAQGEEVVVSAEDLANGTDGPPPTTTSENCHFHAGVEHCDGDQEAVTDSAIQCVVSERDYNKKLRIGTIFIILATSSIGKAPFLHCLHILE